MFTPNPNFFRITTTLTAAFVLCSTGAFAGQVRRSSPAGPGGVSARTRTVPAPVGTARIATPLPECPPNLDGTRQVCPPPPIENALVDTLSNQTIYGLKSFGQPIQADITGSAMYAEEAVNFSGELSGDISGTQGKTMINYVPVSAIPALGFGTNPAAPKTRYVVADADSADPRMDGSIAHPFGSLGIAAGRANAGDRLVLTGTHSGYVVFNVDVTLEGSSQDGTTLYGMIIFRGNQPSTVRNLRVNCTADTACIENSAAEADLTLDRVTVNQSGTGPAVSALTGRLVVTQGRFSAIGGGAAVYLASKVAAASTLSDTRIDTALKGAGIWSAGGGLTLRNVQIAAARNAAVIASETNLRIDASELVSGSVPLVIDGNAGIAVRDSHLVAGPGFAAIRLDIPQIYTFAMSNVHPAFVRNEFETSAGVSSIDCLQSVSVYSHGNVNRNNLTAASDQQVTNLCAALEYTLF